MLKTTKSYSIVSLFKGHKQENMYKSQQFSKISWKIDMLWFWVVNLRYYKLNFSSNLSVNQDSLKGVNPGLKQQQMNTCNILKLILYTSQASITS